MEDKINDEKIIDQVNKSGIVNDGSTLLGQTQESLQILADEASEQTFESSKDVYEEQRQYYFGNAATEPPMESKELDPTKPKSYKEEQNLPNLDENEGDIGD